MNIEEKVGARIVNKLTPVLLVPEIEPCLRFWVERLGFEKTVEVPEGDRLGFVILQKGGVELMYQSYASVAKDAPPAMQGLSKGPTYLYVEVVDLEQVIAAVDGMEVVMPVRTTFYGAKEIAVKDPAGHIVIFAQLGTGEPS